MKRYQSGCLLCGQELDYLDHDEDVTCSYCGKSFRSRVQCMSGHFVCDHCHSMGPNDLILSFCSTTDSMDPMEMTELLMSNPGFNMHGPEHHFLVPAVLITAYYNFLMKNSEEPDAMQSTKIRKLRDAMKRSGNVPGGSCGFHGACGAAVGTGIFISLITDTNPLSNKGWKQANLMTASVLAAIGEIGGPRCCKRSTFVAIDKAIKFLDREFDIRLSVKGISHNNDYAKVCGYTSMNNECIGIRCPFFSGSV